MSRKQLDRVRRKHNELPGTSVNETQLQHHESLVTESTTLEVNLNTDVKALDAGLVITESRRTKSDKHDTSSNLRTYITHDVDADIRLVNDQVPFAEVQLTAQHNVLANEQQHTEQSEPIYDTYLLEKVDSNTTPDSTNMCHRGGEIDQDAEHDQVKSPLLKAEFLKTNDMVEKEVYNELSNRFLQLEKHCISLEISIQQKEESFQSNKPLMMPRKNEHLKQTYKELYDSIKKTRIQTKDHNDSLIAQVNSKTVENADLKAQIQEKISKPLFASQVDDGNDVLSKQSLLIICLKLEIIVLAKPHHVIAPGSSRNSQEESYGSNDMAHNHYLEEARKKTQERNRNSKPIPRIKNYNPVEPKKPHSLTLGVKIGRRVFKSNSLTEAEEEDVAKEKFMLLCSLTKGCMKTEAHNGVKSISLTEAEEEAVAREVHATHAGTVSGPDPEPVQEDQTGSNFGKLHVSLAGPNPEHMDG
ncbi:hypothetical protein Tco_0543300 [Tanacetum coccineum]